MTPRVILAKLNSIERQLAEIELVPTLEQVNRGGDYACLCDSVKTLEIIKADANGLIVWYQSKIHDMEERDA